MSFRKIFDDFIPCVGEKTSVDKICADLDALKKDIEKKKVKEN